MAEEDCLYEQDELCRETVAKQFFTGSSVFIGKYLRNHLAKDTFSAST